MASPQRTTVDFSRSAISRYIQLATLFRKRIDAGTWAVGAQIPTVEELSAECGVARATIRQALDMLEDEGLIERFRAKGTFVRRKPQQELWCEVGTDWSGLLFPKYDATIEVLSDVSGAHPDAVPYQIGDLAPSYRRLNRRHWRHEMPFLLTDLYIDERLSPLIRPEDLTTKTALQLVADLPGVEIVDARQILTIGTADVITAEQLSMPINAPIACVYRRAVDKDGIAVLLASGYYNGEVVRFDIQLR